MGTYMHRPVEGEERAASASGGWRGSLSRKVVSKRDLAEEAGLWERRGDEEDGRPSKPMERYRGWVSIHTGGRRMDGSGGVEELLWHQSRDEQGDAEGGVDQHQKRSWQELGDVGGR